MVKDKTPKDLGIKIGSKEEAEFTKVLKMQEESLLNSRVNQEIAECVIELCKRRIAEEKEKFKK